MAGRNWLAKPHTQMYVDIHSGPGVDAAVTTMSYYDHASRELQAVHQNIRDGLKALSAGWTGQAADGAAATIRASADWADSASVATTVARAQSTHHAGAYVDARNAMPEPVSVPDIAPGTGAPVARVIVDVAVAQAAALAAHAKAADVMSIYESSTAQFVSAMPVYPDLPATTVTTVTAPPTGTGTREPSAGRPRPLRERDGAAPGGGTAESAPSTRPPEPVDADGGPTLAGRSSVDEPGQKPSIAGTAPFSSIPADTTTTLSTVLDPEMTVTGPAPAPGSATGSRPVDGGSERPIPGVVDGMPRERSGGGRPGPAVPTGNQPAAGITRAGAGFSSSGKATVVPPGVVPAGGKAATEDEDHERKYILLDDQHLLDGHPPLPPPVLGAEESL